MKLLRVVQASEVAAGDKIVGELNGHDVEELLIGVEVETAFNTGHGRVQVTMKTGGSGWLNADDLICVLREAV